MKVVDITGQRFGRLMVIDRAGSKKNRMYWNCVCDCGNEVIVSGFSLRQGSSRSCGCLQREMASSANIKDITGQRFGRLTVLYPYTGKRKSHDMLWVCKCDCGQITEVCTTALRHGDTKSCGCYRKEIALINAEKDLTGMRFGKLVAIKKIGTHRRNTLWDCLCDCGKHKVTMAVDLLRLHTTSCGCAKSGIECMISHYLEDNKINFVSQKTFIGCKDINSLPFDFYLPDYNIAIEYDGEFHYYATELGNDLESQQRHDAIKTKYCEENDIILLRIPYWEKDNIESILSDWLFNF